MVYRRFPITFLLGTLVAWMFASCSDDGGSHGTPAVDEESSSSANTGATLPFVDGLLKFTEIDPVNVVYEDHEGDDAGWVELLNTSTDTVNLSGMYLTDSQEDPFKWKFGNVKMEPNSLLLVFMSGKDYPDYVLPHDTLNMIGLGCWTWTDAQSDPPGYSFADPLEGQKKNCFSEDGKRRVGARMQLGENEELGWSSIAMFVGTRSSSTDDVLDISVANELFLRAYITKDRKVSFRLAQPDVDDWKGYEFIFTGTGDSSTVYRARLPAGLKLPDLENIYGTRISPESNESQEVTIKVFDYFVRNRGHEPHAGFKLSKKGGSLYLVNADSAIVDSVAYPEMPVGKTWNYGPRGAETHITGNGDKVFSDFGYQWGYADPSPYGDVSGGVLVSRSPSVESLAEIPPSGFYASPFEIGFPEDASVRCETGGPVPTDESPLTPSLQINSTVTVRCASFVDYKLPGETMTRTYIFENAPAVPAVFLSADPNSLFDPDSGIYMEGNFAQEKEPHFGANYWLDKEIPVTVELMEPGTNAPAFARNAGLKIFGNYSRQNPKKSVAITFREKYGENRLKYALFPEYPELDKFKVFLLRNNGSNFGNDYVRDRLASSVSEGLGVDYQRGRFAVVYYNGEYYGIHSIRERSTEYYFETHYGIDPGAIDLLKADNAVSAGSSVDYTRLMEWLEANSLDDEENYAQVASQIDIDNYLNYMQTEIYADNRDWPANNMKKWRGTSPQTKWKWFLYDLDFGMGNEYSEYKDLNIFDFVTAEDGPGWPNGPEHTLLLRRLLENEGFKAAFINRMSALLAMNFESSRVRARLDAMMSEIEPEIARDQKRWKLSASRMERQLGLIEKFIEERPAKLASEMQAHFELGAAAAVDLQVEGKGRILVHGLPLDSPALTVQFFEGFPVRLTAQPVDGGVFAGWEDGVADATRTIVPGEVDAVKALFK